MVLISFIPLAVSLEPVHISLFFCFSDMRRTELVAMPASIKRTSKTRPSCKRTYHLGLFHGAFLRFKFQILSSFCAPELSLQSAFQLIENEQDFMPLRNKVREEPCFERFSRISHIGLYRENRAQKRRGLSKAADILQNATLAMFS
jgi:hypothetical protein